MIFLDCVANRDGHKKGVCITVLSDDEKSQVKLVISLEAAEQLGLELKRLVAQVREEGIT